jgi:hypothetical protein
MDWLLGYLTKVFNCRGHIALKQEDISLLEGCGHGLSQHSYGETKENYVKFQSG